MSAPVVGEGIGNAAVVRSARLADTLECVALSGNLNVERKMPKCKDSCKSMELNIL